MTPYEDRDPEDLTKANEIATARLLALLIKYHSRKGVIDVVVR